MKHIINKIIKGMGYLPEYGNHPGIPIFVMVSIFGFLLDWKCAIVNLIVWGSLLCYGAYDRTVSYEKIETKT
jgi:hypothetical protein